MLKSMLPAVAVLALAASPAAAQVSTPGVSLTIRDGKVTLKAEQASLRQILDEWERQGQVKVVGADKLVGPPVTLTLVDLPEKQALEIVMRGVPGYMAVDRVAQSDAAASRFDRVVVMARATTPVAATPAASAAASGSRGMPAPAQPPGFQPVTGGAPPVSFVPPAGDDGMVAAGPERNDVEQFQQVEPPMPDAPVASPYPNAYPGSPYVGGGAVNGPYGGNPAAAAAAGIEGQPPPETQFDYANPQRYFEQRRLQQQQQTQRPTSVPTAVPSIGTPVGTTGRPPTAGPTGVPTAPGVLAQPGIAPAPRPQPQPTPAQGEFFNPYNLPADWVPPPATVPDSGTPVEPDRAKYSNPYNPQPPE